MSDTIWTMASWLMDCLQEQFPNDTIPTPGNFCMIAGEQISEDIDPIIGADLCCEGMGWVRIGDAYPSSTFPTPDTITQKCLPLGWATPIEVGLLGCYHPGGQPEMATCAEKTQQAEYDFERLRILQQVACCFGARVQGDSTTRGRPWTITGITVSGPRGNCISRVANFVVSTGRCC